jgi:hypothetical protein
MQVRRDTKQTGPALTGAQVAEFWTWTWSTLDRTTGPERDEASRLAVAIDRALHRDGALDLAASRFTRDQTPRDTALIAHYLITRRDQWGARIDDEAKRRLAIVVEAGLHFGRLLGLELQDCAAHCERLGVSLEKYSVFRPLAREGVIIETIEEGPALPAVRLAQERRADQLLAERLKALIGRTQQRRNLEEVAS